MEHLLPFLFMVDKFLEYLSFEKRYSSLTVQAYQKDLEQLEVYLEEQYGLSAVLATKSQLRSWLVELRSKGCSNKTILRKASAVKSFYKFLLKIGELESNPSAQLILPKVETRLPEYVNVKDIEDLLHKVRPNQEDFTEFRNYTILLTLYASGMRRAELIALKSIDVDLVEGKLKVFGKRSKERLIPVNKEVNVWLRKYQELKAQKFGQQNDVFFVSDKGEKLSEKFVYHLINEYLGKVPSLKKKSPHILRHTFATQMLDSGADLMAIKDLLGHESLSSTQVYTHNTIEKLKSIYKSAHPRERKL